MAPKKKKVVKKHMYGLRALNYRMAPAGTELRVYGIGFGKKQGRKNTVLFTGTLGTLGINGFPTFWSDTEIHVPIPGKAMSGPVGVLRNGKYSNKLNLVISTDGSLIPWLT